CKNIHKRGRLPDMKPVRVAISSSVLAVVFLGFFLIPFPVSRVRETGLVQVQPEHLVPIHVEVPGILEKVHVHEGQKVKKGTRLADFSSPELKDQELKAKSKFDAADKRVRAYDLQLSASTDADERDRLRKNMINAETEQKHAYIEYR